MNINKKTDEKFFELIQKNWFTILPNGDIIRNKTNNIYKQKRKGYIVVDVYKIGTIRGHRLVWMYFNNKLIPDDFVINHINGIKDDNHFENLEAVSQKENMRHAFRTKLCVNKKNKPSAKFIMYAKEILALRQNKKTLKEISLKLNISIDIIKRSIRYLKSQELL